MNLYDMHIIYHTLCVYIVHTYSTCILHTCAMCVILGTHTVCVWAFTCAHQNMILNSNYPNLLKLLWFHVRYRYLSLATYFSFSYLSSFSLCFVLIPAIQAQIWEAPNPEMTWYFHVIILKDSNSATDLALHTLLWDGVHFVIGQGAWN